MNIRVVPLTEEELEQIQVTVADKMLELNKRAHNSGEDVSSELQTLGRVIQKCRNYHPSRNRHIA